MGVLADRGVGSGGMFVEEEGEEKIAYIRIRGRLRMLVPNLEVRFDWTVSVNGPT